VYDNGAVAEGELLRAMKQAGSQAGAPGKPVIAPSALLADLAAQLRVGEAWAKGDPFGLGNFKGLGTVAGMKACSAGDFKPFNNGVAGYEDNVRSWPSVEPADDYTAGVPDGVLAGRHRAWRLDFYF
jgi:hypothetical protein